MATIVAQSISETPLEATYSDAAEEGGDKAANPNGDIFLHLVNGSGAQSATVTIEAKTTTKVVDGYGPMTKANLVVSLGANEEKFVGPFPEGAWNDSDGFLNWDYGGDAAEDVDVAVLKLG